MTKEIKDYLIANLTSSEKNKLDLKIEKFLIELYNSKDSASQRLLICLGIDCANSIKEYSSNKFSKNHYLLKTRDLLYKATNVSDKPDTFPFDLTPRWKFALSLMNEDLESLTPCISCSEIRKYSRISSFYSFLYWVMNFNKKINFGYDDFDGDDDELNRRYRQFQRGKFSNCKISKLGYRYVFVTEQQEIESIGYDNPKDLIDSLGLYYQDLDFDMPFVCINYDSKFHECTWQPDSKTGDWGNASGATGNDFYLSFKKFDNLGRTHSISSFGKSFKEQVHLPIDLTDNKYYDFAVKDLGKLEENIVKNTSKILDEGIKRFKEAIT